MLSLARRLRSGSPGLRCAAQQLRWARTDGRSPRRRSLAAPLTRKMEEKTEWWIVDGEMHEVGENVPPRQRFVIPRDNISNKRRKRLREQFMSRTRLVLKETDHEPWCKKYMELYEELRENWERLYWDEGYSKKIARDHANYDSPEDDDDDFSPYKNRGSNAEPRKDWNSVGTQGDDTLQKVSRIRDKFEYDREKRMREKAFAPMRGEAASGLHESNPKNQPLDAERSFS